MGFKKKVNSIRRKLMHAITKRIGSSYADPKIYAGKKIEINNILIIRPNHRLGNQLLLTPLVQEVINTFPNCKIDLFVKGGVAPIVFQNYPQVNKIIQLPKKPFNELFKYAKEWIFIKRTRYDMVINGDKDSSSGRLLTQLANAPFKLFGDANENVQKQYPDHEHISKSPIYNLRHYLTKLGFPKNESQIPVLDIKLSASEIANGKKILDTIIKNNKKTISIYTNATGDKCYPEDWWETFYARLLKEYPEYNIIEMLPIENISKISFKAPTFYSKDVREMGTIINNTAVFIAADNGVMHLASASLTPTVGFFSVTNLNMYMPYGNASVAIDTNSTNIEDWIASINTILK
ncbi:glycosyltransferase family 9 protein [Mariniflexile sp.]|uniref:glycosyltransferase family 9 protein n=1 Tax=Mariniflexile sp. TaxID=1979402 RepID=UPI0040481E73